MSSLIESPAHPLILASASPRRRDLLREAGIRFEVVPSDAEEVHDVSLCAADLTEMNALRKAEAVAERFPERVVLGADTLVFLGKQIYGKPRDMDDAARMLGELTGRTHEVCTGVALVRLNPSRVRTFHVRTQVTFRALDEEEIHAYLSLIDPLDKAGSYAAQEHGEKIIAKVEGSWTNVVGLPMEVVRRELMEWGRS